MHASPNEDWENFLDNSTVGVHLVDGSGNIVWANKTELCLLGYLESEYFGHHITEFHVDSDVIGTILELLTSGESLSTYPARLLAKDGSTQHVLINSNVYFRDDVFVHTR